MANLLNLSALSTARGDFWDRLTAKRVSLSRSRRLPLPEASKSFLLRTRRRPATFLHSISSKSWKKADPAQSLRPARLAATKFFPQRRGNALISQANAGPQ
jgi:hypothetical protein